jgi:hypothetical protein
MERFKSIGIQTDYGCTERRSETSDSSIFFEAKRQISTLIIPNRKSDEDASTSTLPVVATGPNLFLLYAVPPVSMSLVIDTAGNNGQLL